jgi:preprotein translocase subunit SecB
MVNSNLQEAIENLKISDLYVRDLICKCGEGFDPKYFDMEGLIFQTKHMVTKSEVVQSDDDLKLFRVFVDVGIKWSSDAKEEQTDLDYLALIEATYVAEYRITSELNKECLDEFALRNVSYHVWPYWRELLTSQCERMRLPRIILPTVQFAENHGKLPEQEDNPD